MTATLPVKDLIPMFYPYIVVVCYPIIKYSSPLLLHIFKKREEEGPDIGPTVCQGCGNRFNDIPWTWQHGQLRERARFLVCKVYKTKKKMI